MHGVRVVCLRINEHVSSIEGQSCWSGRARSEATGILGGGLPMIGAGFHIGNNFPLSSWRFSIA